MQPPSSVVPEVVTSLPRLFAGTIYEKSPAQIQENVLYAVQGELMRRGFFRGVINGRPGPATSNAILRLQQNDGLPLSGRLDNETLNDLGAFPGQRNGPPEEGSRSSGSGRGSGLPILRRISVARAVSERSSASVMTFVCGHRPQDR